MRPLQYRRWRPAQIVVVLHPADSPGATGATGTPEAASVAAPSAAAPVVLTATPVVRPAPAAATPVAQTNGSR